MRRIIMLVTALFFSQCIIAQNVGIGTTSLLSRLHVVSTNPGNIAIFNGGTGMFITLTEGVNNRGYIGSSAGNSEDVDFGTYIGSTGKVHLTTAFTPRLTITNTGNVGIGQVNPAVPLNFPDLTGNKISLWGTDTNHYGFGIQDFLLQLYTDGPFSDIAFGYGNTSQGIVYFFLFAGSGTIDSTAVNIDGNAGDTFGFSISGTNGIFAIDAPGKENGANNTQGAVYLFKRTTTQIGIPGWVQQSKTIAPDGAAGDNFGNSVLLLGNILSVGAPYTDAVAANGGAMYVYEKSYATGNYNFFFRKKITDTQSAADDHLGTVIKKSASGLLLGIPDFNIGGKNNAGKFMLVDIQY